MPGRRPVVQRMSDTLPHAALVEGAARRRDRASRPGGASGGRRADGGRSPGRRPRATAWSEAESPLAGGADGRTNRAAGGPRTWRRCCAAWASMVPRQSGACKGDRSDSRQLRGQRATAQRRWRSRVRRRRRTASSTSGRMLRAARRGGRGGADVAAHDRTGQRDPTPERSGVGRASCRERRRRRRARRPRRAPRLARAPDGVEQPHEAAGGHHRRGVVGGLAPGREPDGLRADRFGHVREQRPAGRRPRWRRSRRAGPRPPARVGEGDQRMERADLGAGRHRRRQDATRARRWCGPGLAAVQAQLGRERRRWRRRARSGRSARPRRGRPAASAKARAPATSDRKRSRRAASRLATAVTCQPARRRADAERGPDPPAPMMPMPGGLARLGCWWGWLWSRRGPRRRGGGGPAGPGRGRCRPPRSPLRSSWRSRLRIVARQDAPRLHRPRPAATARAAQPRYACTRRV